MSTRELIEGIEAFVTLYVCPTPIGNLEDITLRVLRVLEEVELVACEDTRTTGKLLEHFGISAKLISYHEHNEVVRLHDILNFLQEDKDVALVSDSGMPGISDPGFKLVRAAVESGVEVTCLPGPNAAVTALVVSAFPTDRFTFEGFFPKKQKDRLKLLKSLKYESRTMVFYESPRRLVETLKDIVEVMETREIAVARELTKVFEEVIRGAAPEVLQSFIDRAPRGEIVVVIKGADAADAIDDARMDEVVHAVQRLVVQGISRKDACDIISEVSGINRNTLYERSLGKRHQ